MAIERLTHLVKARPEGWGEIAGLDTRSLSAYSRLARS